jgi:PAS domain S-box-containing protein
MNGPEESLLQKENQELRARITQPEGWPYACEAEHRPKQHQQVDELGPSQGFFQTVVENSTDAIARLDRDYRHLYVNAAFAGLFGSSPEAIIGRTSRELGMPAQLDGRGEGHVRSVFDSGRTLEIEDSFHTAHGLRSFETRYIAEYGPGGMVASVVAVYHDITDRRRSDDDVNDRKRAEAALYESVLQYKEVFDNISVCVFVLDVTPDGRFKIAAFNPAEEQLVGLSNAQVSGKFIEDLFPEDLSAELIANYRHCLEAGRTIKFDHELNLPGRGRRFFHSNLIPLRNAAGGINRIIGACVETTDFKKTQEEALAKQNLETLGVLAGGIAHDFNNVLGGIHAQAELIESDLSAGTVTPEEIRRIKVAATRGAEIVRELMVYAGQDQSDFGESVDVSRLIQEMLGLLRVSVSKHSALRTDLAENLPPVSGNASQVRRVVMNLVINASEAIGQKDGVITLTTAHVTGRPDLDTDGPTASQVGYVKLEVSDTGCGIAEEAKARIFDPFFTTKLTGRGMGLAVVQRIVHDHEGAINIVSSPGQGTAFQVFLPCAVERASEIQSPVPVMDQEKADAREGTILVVEDEELLRGAVSKSLRRLGFLVVEAGDGSQAMELLRARKDELRAVLLDVTLPGVSSREILDEAGRIRPNMRVVVTSAYSKETVDSTFGLPVPHFIRKPFLIGDLMRMLTGPLSH